MRNNGSARDRRTLFRLVSTVLLLYALAHFAAAQLRLTQTEELAEELAAQRAALEAEHAALRARVLEGEDPEALEKRAREELGLVRPGEIVFYFTDGEED